MDRHPARHLQEVYAVVLGVALVLAVEQVVHVDVTPIRYRLVLPFLAFVSLAFSIYLWGVTYLDRRYANRRGARLSPFGVGVDLLVGMAELLLLIGLSILIARPLMFAVGALALLGFEVIAGLALLAARNYARLGRFPFTYLWINLASAVVLAFALLVLHASLQDIGDVPAGLAVFTVAVARTAAFYATGYNLFFGDEDAT